MTTFISNPSIARQRTAIGRGALSRPLKLALADGILKEGARLFDYGCGRGSDLRHLETYGIQAEGWDPLHRPTNRREPAPVVNLGYVVNVIENPAERQEALRRAWDLAEKVLIVSARLSSEAKDLRQCEEYADGVLTARGTFQKFYEQHELKNWIDRTLEVSALPAGPGVFYVFRKEEERTTFFVNRYRRRVSVPRITRSEQLLNEHRALLQPLIDFLTARGRLPSEEELDVIPDLLRIFGSLKQAFRVVQRGTDVTGWDAIATARAQDILIYLALARFEGRPSFSRLPHDLQLDTKAFFSTYTQACQESDELLFSVGRTEVVNEACAASLIGKQTPSAFYVHESALEHLSPQLRVFEGCARSYIGRV